MSCAAHPPSPPTTTPSPHTQAGASFSYKKGGPVKYEAHEVRAFGLMLADLAQRLDISFTGARSRRSRGLLRGASLAGSVLFSD